MTPHGTVVGNPCSGSLVNCSLQEHSEGTTNLLLCLIGRACLSFWSRPARFDAPLLSLFTRLVLRRQPLETIPHTLPALVTEFSFLIGDWEGVTHMVSQSVTVSVARSYSQDSCRNSYGAQSARLHFRVIRYRIPLLCSSSHASCVTRTNHIC